MCNKELTEDMIDNIMEDNEKFHEQAQNEVAEKTEISIAKTPSESKQYLKDYAKERGMEHNPSVLESALKSSVFNSKKPITDVQLALMINVCRKYQLDPMLKEIYAYPSRDGGIVPFLGVDGWVNLMLRSPHYKNHEFNYAEEIVEFNNRKIPEWIECIITKKSGDSVKIREYYEETKRSTDVWNSMPNRMLRHKALIQCIRITFGYAGIYDEDDAKYISEQRDTVKTENAESEADEFFKDVTPKDKIVS